jgi:hypothetical protein
VDSYSTLGHEGGGNRCGGYTLLWVTTHRDIRRLSSTQVKMEGIVLKATWHCGSDSSVVNDPLVDPGRTPLYVGLPNGWGSVDVDCMFSPHFVGRLLFGDSDRYK